MEQAAWSPPIPSGRAATVEWRRLDRQVRQAMLRGAPAPDPVTAVIALGYARTVLRRGVWAGCLTRFAVAFAVIAVAGGVGFALKQPDVVWVVVVGGIVVFYPLLVRQRQQRLQLVRLEALNAPRLLTAERPPPPEAVPNGRPGSIAGPFTVSVERRRLLRAGATGGGLLLVLAALEFVIGDPATIAIGVVMACLVLLIVLSMALRLRRPLLLTMDPGGVTFHVLRMRLAWSEITEVRILPYRARSTASGGHLVIAFESADPGGLVERLQGRRYWAWRRNARYYGTPLAISDRLLDHGAEEMAALVPVPVRRFTE